MRATPADPADSMATSGDLLCAAASASATAIQLDTNDSESRSGESEPEATEGQNYYDSLKPTVVHTVTVSSHPLSEGPGRAHCGSVKPPTEHLRARPGPTRLTRASS